jgi:histidyl-tRNA synthetase
VARPTPLSGFPEFLPEQRVIEQQVIALLQRSFELHGFAPIETRAVEPLDRLAKGGADVDKEIYVIQRLHTAPEEDPGSDSASRPADRDRLGLHFDLTVPFARYVVENAGQLQFPFRRYQIQKVWRGERPQEGRYREFTQADIDIVDTQTLAVHHDAELPLAALDAFERLHTELGLPPPLMRVNNRRLAQGFYAGLGIDDVAGVLRVVDKLDKIGHRQTHDQLVAETGLSAGQADQCLQLADIRTGDTSFVDRVRSLGVRHELLDAGLDELAQVVSTANDEVPGRMVADLSIARGLDYYTGTVYETELVGFESLGSVASGGRYDSLANDGKIDYPGVGFSFGVSRMLIPLLGRSYLHATRPVPTCVLVAVDTEQTRGQSMAVAAALRKRGIPAEVAPTAAKYGKQIRYADRRTIPYVWFLAGAGSEVKDIRTGEQLPADPDRWLPDDHDLYPRVYSDWEAAPAD